MELAFFTVKGEPKAKQRPKFTTINGHARAITPNTTINYENLVKMIYDTTVKEQFEKGKHLFVLIDAFFAIPSSASKKKKDGMINDEIRPMKKPDWDNIGKIICDSLNTIAYHDDSAIVDGRVRKFFSNNPRVEVFISTKEIDTKQIDEWRKKKT